MIVEIATAGMMYMADASGASTSPADYINPLTVVIKTADKVHTYIQEKNQPILVGPLPQPTINKFKSWAREDFYKDDPYRGLWDSNWINQK